MVNQQFNKRVFIGERSRLDKNSESSAVGGIIIDRNNDLMFKIKVLSDDMNVEDLVNVYHPEIEKFDFEDNLELDMEARKQRFADWSEEQLFFFTIDIQTVNNRMDYGGEVNYVAKDIAVQRKGDDFDENYRFETIPVVKQSQTIKDEKDLSEFLYKGKAIPISNTNFLGSDMDSISSFLIFNNLDTNRTNSLGYLYENLDVSETTLNSIRYESLNDLNSAISIRKIKTDEWLQYAYFNINQYDDLLFVPKNYLLANSLDKNTTLVDNLQQPLIDDDSEKSTLDNADSSKDYDTLFLEHFEKLIKSQKYDLTLEREDLISFYLAVKTNILTILSGLSGTGKSKITTAFADALGILKTNQFKMISVRPSWQDDTDLLGYADTMHNVYRPGDSGLVEILKDAQDNPNKLYVVVLDEMNLARIEHYFSQFISVLERRSEDRVIHLYNKNVVPLFNKENYPNEIKIGSNVRFIGTVNIDESTFSLSDKLIDRANIIQLALLPFTKKNKGTTYKDEGNSNIDFQTNLVSSMAKINSKISENALTSDELSFFWKLDQLLINGLSAGGFGWRTIRNVESFLSSVTSPMNFSREKALDYQVAQRILPKLRGTNENFQSLLKLENNKLDGKIIDLLDENDELSSFEKSREVLLKKARELWVTGFVS